MLVFPYVARRGGAKVRQAEYFQDPLAVADRIIEAQGPELVLALPLGLGKANHIVNAIYKRVESDSRLSLTILTALTLEKPRYENELHRRFLEPVIERLFGDYPQLDYARARRGEGLPPNIRVEEFFFLAGSQLAIPDSQQHHICANYTHALQYLLDRGVNVLAQLVAYAPANEPRERFSASCNADLTLDMLEARRAGQADFLFAGQVNEELPFMAGDALLGEEEFDVVLCAAENEFSLFAPPRLPVSFADYAAGLHVARLVPDGGTLQIGIGSLGDAVAHSLVLRHRDNDRFRQLCDSLAAGSIEPPFDHLSPLDGGLHGLSEMLVEGFLHLYDNGILTRKVDGKVLNAAFFLGSRDFYRRLREMEADERDRFAMRSIFFTNEVLSGGDSKRLSRPGARFVNKAMMVTLRGEVVSDGLEDGRVVSGVGGQFDFAVQAFALAGARSVIVLPATRGQGGDTVSNIRWSYGNTTVPRHLRDIVVTEYGIADLRGRTDAGVIAAMLSVTDSRFQDELLDQAKRAGKISVDYSIPEQYRRNFPQRISDALGAAAGEGLLPDFPLGTEFSEVEQELLKVLDQIKAASNSKVAVLRMLLRGLGGHGGSVEKGLERMGLARPATPREWLVHYLLRGGYGLK